MCSRAAAVRQCMMVRTKRDREPGVLRGELAEAVRQGEAASLASIWKCPTCGAQIQIIVAPDTTPAQPFTCVCGTPMVAGEKH